MRPHIDTPHYAGACYEKRQIVNHPYCDRMKPVLYSIWTARDHSLPHQYLDAVAFADGLHHIFLKQSYNFFNSFFKFNFKFFKNQFF